MYFLKTVSHRILIRLGKHDSYLRCGSESIIRSFFRRAFETGLVIHGQPRAFLSKPILEICKPSKKSVCLRSISTSPVVCKKMRGHQQRKISPTTEKTDDDFLDDPQYSALFKQNVGQLDGLTRISVLHPWVKWGRHKREDTTKELVLEEDCSLVKSLPSMVIPYKETVNLESISKSCVFSPGTLERLVHEIKNSRSQAVFVSVHRLSREQIFGLQTAFEVKVYDRYALVLGIFKHYATSLEAKLQIAMAEMPFVRSRTLTEEHRFMIDRREAMLKATLKKVAGRRQSVMENRKKVNLPTVAIVGYTNCGKTTLIRSLTGDKNIKGEDRLFATLDVTAHKADLPCGMSVVLTDTIGFIQDIPTDLLASFRSTLLDTINADVIVHLRDISHPDLPVQTASVEETLKSLEIPKETPIITVNNKCDKLDSSDSSCEERGLHISAVTGEGLNALLDIIENAVLTVTGKKRYKMKVGCGSEEYRWLRKHCGISNEEICLDDPQYVSLVTVMGDAECAAYISNFRSKG